jgi:formylglycine-generating enzyme required for sulfatase activity
MYHESMRLGIAFLPRKCALRVVEAAPRVAWVLAVLTLSCCATTPPPAPEPPRPATPIDRESIRLPGTKATFAMALLPAGTVRQGNPAREVALSPLRIGVREVTWAEIYRFRDAEKWVDEVGDMMIHDLGTRGGMASPGHPAVGLAWHTAVAYCDWLSRETGYYFRLPTEAEWEYALRAGRELPKFLDEVAWHVGNSGKQTHPPARKEPNAFGLYDMLGNAWEHMLEWERQSPSSAFGPVLRGGSFLDSADLDFASWRQTVRDEWNEADFTRPHSLRWHSSFGPSQGMRLVAVAGPEDRERREQYRDRIEIRITEVKPREREKIGAGRFDHYRVLGEVRNAGARAIDDLEIEIHAMTPEGKPHRMDRFADSGSYGRPAWTRVWPALSNSAWEGEQGRPLAPGETRRFEGRAPASIDDEDAVAPGKFGARVTNLRFSP